ncbi:Zn-ribbon domain-containing OB-fold protein [Actinomadura macra]|uniref:Zn-ribbon domain-containing OB-fold protein n=1 Tax=Actinomadura macra TaxID=46164 RepID=UPI00082D35B3|nr:OB-fold domain-containing protein [Actinomadura macra]
MSVESYEQLLPEITPANRPYWDGLAENELRLQCCDSCGEYRFPDSEVCPRCLSGSFSWRAVSGKGRLWSWIRMHQKYFTAFDEVRPYLVAYVKLDEGPAVISTLVETPDELAFDLPVRAVFQPGFSERTILKFAVERPEAAA